MTRDRVFAWLLRRYPAAHRRRFEAEMRRTFADMCRAREREGRPMAAFLAHAFLDTAAGACREQWSSIAMKSLVTDPRAAALTALALSAPLAILVPVIAFDVEPLHGLAKGVLTRDGSTPNALGFAVLIGGIVALPFALALALVPMLRRGADGKRRARLANLAVAGLIVALMVPTWGGLIEETVRCEVLQIPNCD